MPSYPHLYTEKFDQKTLPRKIAVMVQLGVPYPMMDATEIKTNAIEQGIKIVGELKTQGKDAQPDTKIIAVIAYLQKLGKFDVPKIEEKLQGTPAGIPVPVKPGLPDKFRTTSN
jgi:cytochrome c oxidase cbb3-type subunit I/II